jgi:DMSO/TMAO reductase YedYZ molybdopterin-dependent catalytic subunit/thiosulfate reductase cytochrome b subunit
MVWSGLMIYWANGVYKPFFPEWFYSTLHLKYSLALGMGIHFFLMWFFAFNGLVYVSYLAISGEWKEIAPNKNTFKEAILVTLHDLHLIKTAPPQGKYNAGQRLAYSGITGMSIFLILTGFAIYKPVQLHVLTSLFGGYETARLIHFILMLGVVSFFVIHVLQVIRTGFGNFSSIIAGFEVNSATWRRAWFSFSTALAFAVFVIGISSWVGQKPETDGIQSPLRRALNLNGKIWASFLSPERVAPLPDAPPVGKKPRFNGDLGLKSELDLKNWELVLVPYLRSVEDEPEKAISIKMEDIKKLPRTSSTAKFKCIEGWSDDISYSGVKFTDFMSFYNVGRKADGSLYKYVALETPDAEYYVSIDMKSMMQSQVMLAYEMNGEMLSNDNGAPLRLIIPNKYGIKNLKRIGRIYFSDNRPPDYWEEEGYDWFAGL